MYKITLLERLFDFYLHKLILSFVALFSILASTTPLSKEVGHTLSGAHLDLNFAQFSPAFGAFEDDFLFADEDDAVETFQLTAGKSPSLFVKSISNSPTTQPSTSLDLHSDDPYLLAGFDGGANLRHIPAMKSEVGLPAQKSSGTVRLKKEVAQHHHQAEELRFGPLFAAVPAGASKKHVAQNNKTGTLNSGRAIDTARPSDATAPSSKEDPDASVEELAYDKPNKKQKIEKEPEKEQSFDTYNLTGSLSLKGGLAYFGTLEAVWVVGDEILSLGSINTPDATYQISVSELLGEVVVSLYDNNDQLIGEGLLELAELGNGTNQIQKDIDIHPINWDGAGQVVHVHSLGGHSFDQTSASTQPIAGAQIQLYSFNLASETSSTGHFQFSNWKKANSRTLAIASKTGYRDSIFMLDSRREARVPLFTEKYIDAFFNTLEDQGLYNRQDKGTIYGSLLGANQMGGYKVRLRRERAIYFNSLNMADLNLEQTSANGLFAFVGLQDGDYELTLEKDGEIVDHRVISVEQGKVSPLIIDLKQIYKHIEFFDPLNPNVKVSGVDISFFDGVFHQKLDKKQRLKAAINGGNEPNMIEYSVGADVGRIFVSRRRGLERLPLITGDKLQTLAEQKGLNISEGLVFGFIETNQHYSVDIAEGSPIKTIYFDENGQEVSPETSKLPPYGFIMGGFYQGLNTLLILNQKGEPLASDIVFSDHTSISIVNLSILSL